MDDLQKREDYMGKVGLFTGLQDCNGADIHIGDTLEFNRREWGGDNNTFVVEFYAGELHILGSVEDLSNWCTVIKKWNA